MLRAIQVTTNQGDLKVSEFDISKMKSNACIFIIGKGRFDTTLDCMNIIDTISAQSSKSPDEYQGYVVGTKNCLRKFNERFENVTLRNNLNVLELLKHLNNDSDYIVCDNCIGPKSSSIVEQIIKSEKKLRIITMQFPVYVRPDLLHKIDYIFVHNEDFYSNLTKIYKLYINNKSPANEFKRFVEILKGVTVNNNCLVVDNTKKYGSVKDDNLNGIYWYNALCKNNDKLIDKTIIDLNTPHINKFIEQAHRLIDNKKPTEDDESKSSIACVTEPVIEPVTEPVDKPIIQDIVNTDTKIEKSEITQDMFSVNINKESGSINILNDYYEDGTTTSADTADTVNTVDTDNTIDTVDTTDTVKETDTIDKNASYFNQCMIL